MLKSCDRRPLCGRRACIELGKGVLLPVGSRIAASFNDWHV